MQPSLTTAVPGGLNLTVAKFYNSGTDSIITVKLLNSANTSNFHKVPPTGPPLDADALDTFRGLVWTRVDLPLIGDYGVALADLAIAHMDTIAEQGRSSTLTTNALYTWLCSLWPNIRTIFISSTNRQLPYTMSFLCPSDPPRAMVADIPNAVSPDSPAYIPALQIHVPAFIPYSALDVSNSNSQAVAQISYPTMGMSLLGGSPVVLISDPGTQTLSSHTFRWYIPGMPELSGLQVGITFPLYTATTTVPVSLLVTNILTGVSDVQVIYITVVP